MKEIDINQHQAVCQLWEESERGWGVTRMGFSLHRNVDLLGELVDIYWDVMPDAVPDTYARPEGDPYVIPVEKQIEQRLQRVVGIFVLSPDPPMPFVILTLSDITQSLS